MGELLTDLESEKTSVQLAKTIYDIAMERSAETKKELQDDNERLEDKGKVDFLSPFLAGYPTGKPLNERQALCAKEDCLASLKERLLERANIIQVFIPVYTLACREHS